MKDLYVAHCTYFATGEGWTHWMTIANSAASAEKLFKERADEYFHRGMEVVRYEDLDDTQKQFLPPAVISALDGEPTCRVEFTQTFHFNCA